MVNGPNRALHETNCPTRTEYETAYRNKTRQVPYVAYRPVQETKYRTKMVRQPVTETRIQLDTKILARL